MATVTRPSGAYSPANPITNTTKYQDDSAATSPRVAISSVKVDGDINKAFDVLTDHDDTLDDHEIRIDALEGAAAVTEFSDSVFRVLGSVDSTKKLAFEVDGISTATTRTLTVQDVSGTVAVIQSGDLSVPATSSTASSVTLAEDTDNGANTVKIIAPTAITSNRTLTLPDETGTVVTSASSPLTFLPTGTVIQTVQTVKSDSYSMTSTTFADVTGLSVSITPRSTSSKILVRYSAQCSADANQGFVRLMRDSTPIGVGTADGSRVVASSAINNTGAGGMCTSAGEYLDSPATTSSVTYKIQIATNSGGSTVSVNRMAGDSNSSTRIAAASSITVQEIVG